MVGISFYERARRTNVFPITLRPYRSNFAAVVNTISDKGLIALDKGIEIEIAKDSKRVLLIAFTFVYISDIP